MGKRFRLRLSRMLPTFQSCRSKEPSDLPITPLPTYFHVSPIKPKFIDDIPVPQPASRSHHSSIKRHVSSAVVSIGCGCVSKSSARYVKSDDNTESNEFRWKKEEKWHVVARVKGEEEEETPRRKIYYSSIFSGMSDGDMVPSTPLPEKKKKQRNRKKKSSKPRVRLSTSSIDSGWFSSEGGEENDEETETLVSSTSRTFSTDSSSDQFDSRHLETIRESPINDSSRKKKKTKKKNPKRIKKTSKRYASKSKGSSGETVTSASPESFSPARLSVLMPCKVEGKVKESFAVVKKSEEPYEDFRNSMLDMILERQMFEARDLEQLLNCFLSLNSRHHHCIIVEAFSEIWEFLFCRSRMPQPQPQLVVSETEAISR